MKYMIMECHQSYAIALDENGQFIKVANMHYEVGDMTDKVYALREVSEKPKKYNLWFNSLKIVMVIMIMAIGINYYRDIRVYGSVYMSINPEIRIDVNHKDEVMYIESMNDDAKNLLLNYDYKNKKLDLVMEELVDKAIAMNYLMDGGAISLRFDGESEWVIASSDNLKINLDTHLNDKISIDLTLDDEDDKVTIPIGKDDSDYDDNDYDDSKYEIDIDDYDDYDDYDDFDDIDEDDIKEVDYQNDEDVDTDDYDDNINQDEDDIDTDDIDNDDIEEEDNDSDFEDNENN